MSHYDAEEDFQGRKLDVFTGDKALADEFLQQWQLFAITNDIERKFTAYKTVLLFLTYIKGPDVDEWVRRFFKWNKTQIEGGIDENDPRLIKEMKEAFRERFGDSQEKLRAQQALREGIVMKGYDMDTYVAQFEELVRKAGYSYQEPQVIDLEKPHTYQEWRAALERVLAIRRKLEACKPELSRSSPPSNTPSLSSLDGERSEDDDEESLAEERTLEWQEELKLAQENDEQNAKTTDEAVEYGQLPSSHKIKRERRQKKKVRINEWTEEYAPPDKAREQYVPDDLAPARTPSRWEQQVQHAHQELMTAQMQGPSTWAWYRFHPDAMDQGARVRVRQGESRLRMAHIEEVIDRPQVCYHCRLPGHIRPLCPNRGQPRAKKSRGRTQMPGKATIRRVQEQSAQPAKKQPTVPPPVVRARVEPPPVQARPGYRSRNEEVAQRNCRADEDAVRGRWQQCEDDDPELFEEVWRRGLCPTDVSGSPPPRGMIAGTSLRSMGVQRGRCPKKEGNVTCVPARDRQTAKRGQKARAEEWIKSEDGITEMMTGPNGVYTRFVSTSPPESEQDDAAMIGFMWSRN